MSTEWLDGITNEWLDLKAERDKIDGKIADVEAVLLGTLAPGDRHETMPGVGLRIQAPSRRLDKARAAEVLTEAQYDSICVWTPNADKARAVLPGYVTDLFITASGKCSVRAL